MAAKKTNTTQDHPEALAANEALAELLSGNEKYYLMTSKKELQTVVSNVQETMKDMTADRYAWNRDECDELEKAFEHEKKVPECINIVGRMVSHLNECLTHYNSTLS